jgi:hypothetical protein
VNHVETQGRNFCTLHLQSHDDYITHEVRMDALKCLARRKNRPAAVNLTFEGRVPDQMPGSAEDGTADVKRPTCQPCEIMAFDTSQKRYYSLGGGSLAGVDKLEKGGGARLLVGLQRLQRGRDNLFAKHLA